MSTFFRAFPRQWNANYVWSPCHILRPVPYNTGNSSAQCAICPKMKRGQKKKIENRFALTVHALTQSVSTHCCTRRMFSEINLIDRFMFVPRSTQFFVVFVVHLSINSIQCVVWFWWLWYWFQLKFLAFVKRCGGGNHFGSLSIFSFFILFWPFRHHHHQYDCYCLWRVAFWTHTLLVFKHTNAWAYHENHVVNVAAKVTKWKCTLKIIRAHTLNARHRILMALAGETKYEALSQRATNNVVEGVRVRAQAIKWWHRETKKTKKQKISQTNKVHTLSSITSQPIFDIWIENIGVWARERRRRQAANELKQE